MPKCSLLLVPVGGLANRMRSIVSAYSLCQKVDARMTVVWFRDWAVNAPFSNIFRPIDDSLFELREARLSDYLINDRPRRRNFWLPKPFQLYIYDDRIYEATVDPRKQTGFDFEAWLKGKKCYMSCFSEFGTFPNSLYNKIFQPVDAVMATVKHYEHLFSSRTIGMHIRRTDLTEAIQKSPTHIFIAAAQKEIEHYPDTKIFLATDSDEVKRNLSGIFGDRLITSNRPASRNNTAGIQDGLADLFTLSRTVKIYGSAGSSFSTMASSLNGTDLEVLKV